MFSIVGGATEFNQWDLFHTVVNDCLTEGEKVIFRNSTGETFVKHAYFSNAGVVVDVPNKLLQKEGTVLIASEEHKSCTTTFNVLKAEKPEFYDEDYYELPSNREDSRQIYFNLDSKGNITCGRNYGYVKKMASDGFVNCGIFLKYNPVNYEKKRIYSMTIPAVSCAQYDDANFSPYRRYYEFAFVHPDKGHMVITIGPDGVCEDQTSTVSAE